MSSIRSDLIIFLILVTVIPYMVLMHTSKHPSSSGLVEALHINSSHSHMHIIHRPRQPLPKSTTHSPASFGPIQATNSAIIPIIVEESVTSPSAHVTISCI